MPDSLKDPVVVTVFSGADGNLGELYDLRLRCLSTISRDPALPGDTDDSTRHVGVRAGSLLVAVGSLLVDPAPFDLTVRWRLRALAVHEQYRRQGFGLLVCQTRLALCARMREPAWTCARIGPSEHLHRSLGARQSGSPFMSSRTWSETPVVNLWYPYERPRPATAPVN